MSIQYTTDQLQEKFPDGSSPGFARVAETMRAEGRVEEAMQLCNEGLRARPYQLSGYLVLGKCLLDANRLEESREQFEAALNLDPRCLSALHHLGLIMGGLSRHGDAAGYYRTILSVEPWDGKARSLLNESSAAAAATGASAASQPSAFAPHAPAQDADALADAVASNAIDFDPNRVADFLPVDSDSGIEEISLADALAPSFDAPSAPLGESAKSDMPEPTPMDVLRDNAGADAANPGSPSPISGQDVEDRLDSLFGLAEETGTLPASASGGWKAALIDAAETTGAETSADFASPESDSAPAPRFSDPGDATLFLPESKAAPSSRETGVFPPDSFSDEAPTRMDEAPAPEDAFEGERVSGADIENRLDELFDLGPEESATIPMRPKVEDPEDYLPTLPSAPAPAPAPEARKIETEDIVLAPEDGNTTQIQTPGDLVTGQDVADKLEDLFGADTAPSAAAPAASETSADARVEDWGNASGDILSTESMLPSSLGGDGPAPVTGADIEDRLDQLFDLGEDQPEGPAAASFSAPGPEDEGMVTLELPKQADPEARAPLGPDENDRTVLMPALKEEPVSDWLTHEDAPAAAPAEEASPLVDALPEVSPWLDAPAAPVAPAARVAPVEEPAASDETAETARASESAGLARPPEDARDTMFISNAADTAAIEMVEGADVAARLDEMFQDDGADAFQIARTELESRREEPPAFLGDDPEMLLPPMEPVMPEPSAETVVSGEDVSARLSELFQNPGAEIIASEPPMEVPLFLEDENEAPAPSRGAAAPAPAQDETLFDRKSASPAVPAPKLQPMQDEEEGYPEEEEAQEGSSAAGANVATVTLAEIYFQQGLREQALQIYRQLLEREPGNDSVRKRIQEIEASKPEDEKGGGDPRRPRPGLKVPKRKK